jgi:cysteine-rich repeat protein
VVNQDIEECDDGDQTNDDTCTNDCALTVCGDGMIQDPNSDNQIETCDDGNTTDGDGCSSSCIIEVDNPVCGD